MDAALEGESWLGRTSRQVGRPELRQASATKRPMNPVDPIIMVRPASKRTGTESIFMFTLSPSLSFLVLFFLFVPNFCVCLCLRVCYFSHFWYQLLILLASFALFCAEHMYREKQGEMTAKWNRGVQGVWRWVYCYKQWQGVSWDYKIFCQNSYASSYYYSLTILLAIIVWFTHAL